MGGKLSHDLLTLQKLKIKVNIQFAEVKDLFFLYKIC